MRKAGPQVIVSKDPRYPGQYLKSYDPEAHDGLGDCEWTAVKAEALVYPTFIAAFEAWRRQSTTRPYRDDFKPNRPLTAFTVTFEPAV